MELLALRWSVTVQFRKHLLGHKFIIYTDINLLSYLAPAILGTLIQQQAAQLAHLDYEIRYRFDKTNKNADALSQQYLSAILSSKKEPPLSHSSQHVAIMDWPTRVNQTDSYLSVLPVICVLCRRLILT